MNRTVTLTSLFVLTVVFAAVFAAAQEPGPIAGRAHAKIWTRGAFGGGIAISQSDPMDFEFIRVGIAGVKIVQGENETVRKAGVLYFGEEKYRLRDVSIGNGTASATIWLNDSQVGSISLDSYVKGDREVWAGTMTLNGNGYNVYVIQIPKALKADEKADRAHEYCKNNPERCRAAMRAVGHNIVCDPVTDGNCRNRIRDFCKQNPEDSRCKALRIAECRENTEDAGCRAELMGVCRNNATEKACDVLVGVYSKNIEKRPETVESAPDWFRTVRTRIEGRLQEAS